VNGAYKFDEVEFDFLFFQDYCGLTYIEDVATLQAKKFYGIVRHDLFKIDGRSPLIPESIAIRHCAARYYVNTVYEPRLNGRKNDFVYDLCAQPLTCYGSVIFPAMQFALWCCPARIFIVGCDVSNEGYFYEQGKNALNIEMNLLGWKKMKEFAHAFYPETEIISINPVGLRGIFTDIQQ
jgi:hypothetical protein